MGNSCPGMSSGPELAGELCGVGEFLEFGHLAVLDGEYVAPIAVDLAAVLAQLPDVIAEHEHAVVGGIEVLRREADRVLVLSQRLEELLDPGLALPVPAQRVILAAAVNLPIRIRRHRGDDS